MWKNPKKTNKIVCENNKQEGKSFPSKSFVCISIFTFTDRILSCKYDLFKINVISKEPISMECVKDTKILLVECFTIIQLNTSSNLFVSIS